jgi:hypothetical protein
MAKALVEPTMAPAKILVMSRKPAAATELLVVLPQALKPGTQKLSQAESKEG